MDPKDHVAGMILDGGSRMHGTIIEELCDGFHGGVSALGLLGGNGTQCSEECAVHGSSIIEEHTSDLLDSCGVGGIKAWGSAWEIGELDLGPILGFLPCVW